MICLAVYVGVSNKIHINDEEDSLIEREIQFLPDEKRELRSQEGKNEVDLGMIL